MTALVADAPVRKRLPLWASTLASLVVVTVIAIIAGAYGIFYYVEILSERAHDPSYIKATAAKIADFPEPLPEGYEMKAAIDLDFFHFAMVAMVNKKDHQAISICAMSPASADPKGLLDSSYRAGLVYYAAKFQEIKSQGKETIAGEEMPYIVGRFVDSSGRTGDGLVACIVIKKLSKNILIYALPTGDNPYNLETSLNLIRSIKGF